jgi:hypothetical protein
MWEVFGFTIILTAICGVGIVFVSLFLLARGTITLKREPGGSVKVELGEFKFLSDVPALGLFAIGLVFVLGALGAGRPSETALLEIKGTLDAADRAGVTLVLDTGPWQVKHSTTPDGTVADVLHPELYPLVLHVKAPGHEIKSQIKVLDKLERRGLFSPGLLATVGTISVGRLVEEAPSDQSNVTDHKKVETDQARPNAF